jgi:polyvinyl alcohol dehydrogenase (cytochrome)
MLETESGVPSAIVFGKTDDGAVTAYFGDLAANVYAVKAANGELLWKVKVDDYPLARVRAAPILHAGRLYVPVSSREESRVRDPRYPCCRFRGSMVALDAVTGKQMWKTYTIPEPPRRTQKSRSGTQLWGPSGVAIWVTPSLDPERRTLYVGTGNDYSVPATSASDAIVAFDMDSGAIRWVRQMTENDIWNSSCRQVDRDPAKCPDPDAPDFDFAASPILVKLEDGRQMLIAAQKSGLVYALDLDREGEILWYRRVGKGGTQGGIMFGPAADSERLYVAISDFERMPGTRDANPEVGGGMVAIALENGEQLWRTPAPSCGDRAPCSPAQGAAITATAGVVFSGSVDGHLRAYSTKDGKILWDYDTVRDFTTVNGVQARGGSFYSGGPAVVKGMLFASPGYAHHGGIIPGNVLLAFSVDGN